MSVRLETLRDITIPCEASGDEADMSDEDPRLGTGDGLFPIFRQSPASVQPCESALDHPSAWDDLEALGGVGAFDDLHCPAADLVQSAAQLRPCVAAIGKDMAQPGEGVADGVEHLRRAGADPPVIPYPPEWWV